MRYLKNMLLLTAQDRCGARATYKEGDRPARGTYVMAPDFARKVRSLLASHSKTGAKHVIRPMLIRPFSRLLPARMVGSGYLFDVALLAPKWSEQLRFSVPFTHPIASFITNQILSTHLFSFFFPFIQLLPYTLFPSSPPIVVLPVRDCVCHYLPSPLL